MFRVKTLNNIANAGLSHLPKNAYEVAGSIADPHVILVRSASMHELNFADYPSLLTVARAGAGYNNIPLDKLSALGIPVFNAPGANANAVKELVLGGMLLASRNLCQAREFVQQLHRDQALDEPAVEAAKKNFVGTELAGKTLGIIGLGNIGVKLANAALALGMRVIGYDPAMTIKHALALSSAVKPADTLDELLKHSDFISIHVPLTHDTRDLLDETRLSILQPHAVLLNFSRGEIVNNQAVLQALTQKKLQAYVADFPDSELASHPQAILLPHLGASTREAEENCAVMVVKQIRDFLEQGNITNSVNLPELQLAMSGASRICLVNRNVPGMISQISQQLAQAGLNITGMANKSKADIAYSIFDLETVANEQSLTQIASIPGVIRLRQITAE